MQKIHTFEFERYEYSPPSLNHTYSGMSNKIKVGNEKKNKKKTAYDRQTVSLFTYVHSNI